MKVKNNILLSLIACILFQTTLFSMSPIIRTLTTAKPVKNAALGMAAGTTVATTVFNNMPNSPLAGLYAALGGFAASFAAGGPVGFSAWATSSVITLRTAEKNSATKEAQRLLEQKKHNREGM